MENFIKVAKFSLKTYHYLSNSKLFTYTVSGISAVCSNVGLIYTAVNSNNPLLIAVFAFLSPYSNGNLFYKICCEYNIQEELKELHETTEQLNSLNNEYKLQINEQNDSIDQLNDENSKLNKHNNELELLLNDLQNENIKYKTNNEEFAEQLSIMKSENVELTRMLENSKKLVNNLIIAGDDYKKFNNKFGKNLTELGETSKDLKKHTELLGKIANKLAKDCPDDKIHQMQIDFNDESVQKSKKLKNKLNKIIQNQ
jgi:myosin heavy subunit